MPEIFNPKTGRMEPVAPGVDMMALLNRFAENQDLSRQDGAAPPPPVPAAPAMFRPQPAQPPDVGALMRRVSGSPRPADAAPRGITVGGSPDWANEREQFIERGSSPEIGAMADALEGRRLSDENLGSRPDLQDDERAKYAMQGLRQAAQMSDPAYRREQASEDAISGAETYLNPTVAAARSAETGADVSHQEAMQQLAIRLGIDPRVAEQKALEFQHQKELHQIDASGRNPLASLLSGQGGAAPAGHPGGGTVRMQAPDGSVRDVPAGQAEYYKSRGAQVVR